MDEIVDLEYLLRPLSDPVSNPRIARFEVRSIRQAQFEQAEQYQNFIDYGSEFGEAQAPEPPEWGELKRACESHLANKCKDLWVATWYVECLLIQYGFRGGAEGFTFLKQLIEQHWDSIQPSPDDEDGIEATVKMISGLNNGSTFIDELRMAPITVPTSEHPALSIATYDQVDGGVRGELIGNTDDETRQQITLGISSLGKAFDEFVDALKEKCGDEAPPSAKIRETLQQCESKVREIYPAAFAEEPAPGDAEDASMEENAVATVDGEGVSINKVVAGKSHVQNREEAFRALESVAKFFRENEPQSPVSYLLEKAVRWGHMALPDLIAEMVDDDDTKFQIFRLAGLKSDTEEEDY